MPMVPLSFVLAAVLLLLLWRELIESDLAHRNWFMATFVGLLTVHLLLVGVRYGYAQDWIRLIHPFMAAVLAPLAYLAFRNPERGTAERSRVWRHLLPLAITILIISFAITLLDVFLGVINICYAIALGLLGRQGHDSLSWARLDRITGVERVLWVVAALLLMSGITDIAIAIDFLITHGANTASIAGLSTAFGIFVICVVLVALHRAGKTQPVVQSPKSELSEGTQSPASADSGTDEQAELLVAIDDLINSSRLHHDPDLNLNRLSRKLGVPARQVSTAINRVAGMSVSQYINQRRIVDACALLQTTDMTVTNVMLASGYNTKSNFNREFKRVTGMSPSHWRTSKEAESSLSD